MRFLRLRYLGGGGGGHGDLVSRLITSISHKINPNVPVINLLTNLP